MSLTATVILTAGLRLQEKTLQDQLFNYSFMKWMKIIMTRLAMTRYWIEPLWHETRNVKSMQKAGSQGMNKKVQWRYTVSQWCTDQSLTTNTRWNTGTNVGKAQTHVHFQGCPQEEKLNCYHQTLLEDDEPDRWLFFVAKQQGNDSCELLQVIWATAPSHQFLKRGLLLLRSGEYGTY